MVTLFTALLSRLNVGNYRRLTYGTYLDGYHYLQAIWTQKLQISLQFLRTFVSLLFCTIHFLFLSFHFILFFSFDVVLLFTEISP